VHQSDGSHSHILWSGLMIGSCYSGGVVGMILSDVSMFPLPLMSKGERRHVKKKKWLLIKGGAVKEEKTCKWLLLIGGVMSVSEEKFLS